MNIKTLRLAAVALLAPLFASAFLYAAAALLLRGSAQFSGKALVVLNLPPAYLVLAVIGVPALAISSKWPWPSTGAVALCFLCFTLDEWLLNAVSTPQGIPQGQQIRGFFFVPAFWATTFLAFLLLSKTAHRFGARPHAA